MEVYRYIDYNRFKEIVEKKKLYFVNPFTEWDDDKEGFLYREAQRCGDLEESSEILKNIKNKKAIIDQLRNGGLYKQKDSKEVLDWFGMRCQSWSKSKDSQEMWNNYSYNKRAICIATDTGKLLQLHYNDRKVEGVNVVYKNNLNVEDEIKCDISRNGTQFNFPFVLSCKLKDEFMYENEYRLYINLLDSCGRFNGKDHNGVFVPIDFEITEFINEVYCHPDATKDFVDEVKKYCGKNGLRFIAR